MNYCKFLSSQQVYPGKPWEFVATAPIPEAVRTDKAARDIWINNPKTEHSIYSLIEGVNSSLRVSAPKGAVEGNAPQVYYGIAGDYDVPATPEEIQQALSRADHKPNWIETTLSGNTRALWIFERPISLPPASAIGKAFLRVAMDQLALKSFLPGLDEPATLDPARRWTNACKWTHIHDAPLSGAMVVGWSLEAIAREKYASRELGLRMPLAEAAKFLAAKYPRFAEWPGEFVLGSQGPSFWVDGSTSPKSAIVCENGIHSFAAHASHKPFWNWIDLLGKATVEQFITERRGRAVEDVFADARNYWFQDVHGIWRTYNRDQLASHLACDLGVSRIPDKTTKLSELEEAINSINLSKRVDGAAPFHFQGKPGQIVKIGGRAFLNTSRLILIKPAEGVALPERDFPFIHKFLWGFFDPPEQLNYLLAWLQHAYYTCYHGHPESGQSIFVAGGPGVGKTLLAHGIIGEIFGGAVGATRYLSGLDQFGSDVFDSFILTSDDAEQMAEQRKHVFFSEKVKSLTANPKHQYHAKFCVPVQVIWTGRVVVTLNLDEESLRQLPLLGISNLDKISLYRAVEEKHMAFPRKHEIIAILAAELPFFLRWLLDWKAPEHCIGDTRFGTTPWHEQRLLEAVNRSSAVASFNEILDDYLTRYFSEDRNKHATFWQGTALQLWKGLASDPAVAMAMKFYAVADVNRQLATLKNQGADIQVENGGAVRLWRIARPTHLGDPQSPLILPQGSKFSKP